MRFLLHPDCPLTRVHPFCFFSPVSVPSRDSNYLLAPEKPSPDYTGLARRAERGRGFFKKFVNIAGNCAPPWEPRNETPMPLFDVQNRHCMLRNRELRGIE